MEQNRLPVSALQIAFVKNNNFSQLCDSCDIGFRVQFDAEFSLLIINISSLLRSLLVHCYEQISKMLARYARGSPKLERGQTPCIKSLES